MKNSERKAFPPANSPFELSENLGLTKREYAAIQAMAGILSGNSPDINFKKDLSQPSPYNQKQVAASAIQYADALFEQLDESTS